MTATLTLGYSPCPNDTFIFHALAHGLVDAGPYRFQVRLADVEELNRLALAGEVDVCKVSAAALPRIAHRYAALRSGGAMGRGVGPILVSGRPGDTLADLAWAMMDGAEVAVPGGMTTANLLFGLLSRELGLPLATREMPFHQIMDAVAAGRVWGGVVIHEGRFTYEKAGLTKLADLGRWWERSRGLPLPLGAIVARRDLGEETLVAVQEAIRLSLLHARANPEAPVAYIRRHAQELDPAVIEAHIRTFVTDFSLDVGTVGEAALDALVRAGLELGGADPPGLPLLAPPGR